jgi:osmotically-inducible protein OsmY
MSDVSEMNDAEIQQAVLRELAWDPRVDAASVGVTVDARVVTLAGTVRSHAERVAAQEAAHRVVDVRDVANDLQVELPGERVRTDADIAQAVRHALEWDVLVPEQQVTSTVSAGWVTLEGAVDDGHQRESAERAIQHLTGVRGVTNQIAVSGPHARAGDVQRAIEDALERRAKDAAKRINVVVGGDWVLLSGDVQSWAERAAILDAVRATPGVRAVEARLRVAARP